MNNTNSAKLFINNDPAKSSIDFTYKPSENPGPIDVEYFEMTDDEIELLGFAPRERWYAFLINTYIRVITTKCSNKRVRHLIKYARKKRTRKKNINRAFDIWYKEV